MLRVFTMLMLLLPARLAEAGAVNPSTVVPSIRVQGHVNGRLVYDTETWGDTYLEAGVFICSFKYDKREKAYYVACADYKDNVIARDKVSCWDGDTHRVVVKISSGGEAVAVHVLYSCAKINYA